MATLTQEPGVLDVETLRGDDFSMTLTFDPVLTGYTYTASVLHPDGTEAVAFTRTSESESGVTLSLTDTQTAALTCNAYSWEFVGTLTGYTRTLLAGEFKLS